MKDIKQLRDDLTDLFDKVKTKKIDPEQASLLTNCAGKIIGTLRVELEYAALQEETPEIEFITGKKATRKK